jgi:hypothetical protein
MKIKIMIGGLYLLFFFAMIFGIAIAFRQNEGLVETNYYEKGNGWFQARATEQRLGFEVIAPASLSLGENDICIRLSLHGKPVEGAEMKLFLGNISTTDRDFSCSMRETAPGVYQAKTLIPFKGKWLVRMDLASSQLKTSRSWFYDIR